MTLNLEGLLKSAVWATSSQRVALRARLNRLLLQMRRRPAAWEPAVRATVTRLEPLVSAIRLRSAEAPQRIAHQMRGCLAAWEPAVRATRTRLEQSASAIRLGSAEAPQWIADLVGRITRLTKTRRDLPSAGHLWWALKLWVDRLGSAGVVGLGLCAFAAMLYLSAVLTLQDEQAQLLEELDASRARAKRVAASPIEAPRTPGEQLSDFYALFPSVKAVPETLRKINQLAEKQQLVLRAGDYHVTDDRTGRLVRYEVTFPIEGPYPNVRRFLRTVLAEVHSAALDKIDVEKHATDDAQAKTTVSLTLFARRDS